MQYTNIVWRNGQPYSEQFDDIYYSSELGEGNSGVGEFNHVFFKHNNLAQRWRDKTNANRENFVIAELGLGSTLNCLLTIHEWLKYCDELSQTKSDANATGAVTAIKTLHYIAIERYPLSPDAIRGLLSGYSELEALCEVLLEHYPAAVETTHIRRLFDNRVVIHYKFMDVMDALASSRLNVDAWYLDGFSPAKNTEMWSRELFEKIVDNSHAGSTCSTYTSAGFVKRNMQYAGLEVKKVAGFGKKRDMLVAMLPAESSLGERILKNKYSLKTSGEKTFSFKDKPWFRLSAFSSLTAVGCVSQKATVIGAGIAGLSVAQALIKRGWEVTVIDRHEGVAGEASSNLAAIVYPRLSVDNDIDSEFYIAAYCYALTFLNDLQKNGVLNKFWYEYGILQLMDNTRLNKILNKYQFNETFAAIADTGMPGANLIRSENFTENLSVLIKNKQKTYMHYKHAGVVLPKKLCEAIQASCSADDCPGSFQLVQNAVSHVSFKGGKWQCYKQSQLIDEADVLIVANGQGINDLKINASECFIKYPVEVVRGQMLELKSTPASRELKKTINEHVYLTHAMNGYHYLGGTYSRTDINPQANKKDTVSLLESAEQIYPFLFDTNSCNKPWVGFRVMANDRSAIVGPVPDVEFFKKEYSDIANGDMKKRYKAGRYLPGLYISAAHGSRGFTQSFLSAEIIASQINAEPSPVSDRVLNYINPSRFIVNDLKRR